MNFKTVLLLIISAALIFSALPTAFATEYVFDENGVVIAEPEYDESFDYDEDTAIGIIGGADGPTAIMVADGPSFFLFTALAVAAIAVITILIILLKRRNKNK